MWIVTGSTRAVLNRWMDNRRLFHSLGKIFVTFQAQIPDCAINKSFIRRFMGVMTFGTGSDGNRTMHELLLERRVIMTAQTEVCLVLADI